ncbi:unnamed protein product [Blepharisma stoltei]|uniref:Uncharacterized protein n=1 Tax=Blepharisma stoltei TaxID=1481888 RepID=A0AAU9KCW4_9CILI|nr:unnamed protein product [Blepharisma stoltei]
MSVLEKRKLKQELAKKEEELKSLEDKIQKIQMDKARLEGSCSAKSTQLKGSEHSLNDLQRTIAEVNQEIIRIQNLKDMQNKDKPDISKRVDDKEFKEVGKKLQEKLEELAKAKLPILPTKTRSIHDLREKTENVPLVHTAKILYTKNLKDGDFRKLDRSNAVELSVRLNSSTTFQQLKLIACKHWNLDENLFALRAPNYSFIDHFKDNVVKIVCEQRMKPEFWIIQKDNSATKSFTDPDDYFIEENYKNQFSKQGNRRQKRALNDEGRKINYNKFLLTYEGMQTHLPDEAQVNEDWEKERLSIWSLSSPTLVVITIILALTLGIHIALIDLEKTYWISYEVDFWLSQQIATTEEYLSSMTSILSVKSFITSVLARMVYASSYDSSDPPLTSEYFIPVGPLRIRTLRTQEKSCFHNDGLEIENATCYHSEYDDDTKYTEKLNLNSGNTQDYEIYRSTSYTNISSILIGEFSNYDGSGYVKDFTYSLTLEEFTDQMNAIFEKGWIDNSVRAVIISLSFYLPNSDYWIWDDIIIEISVTGQIKANPIRPYIFHGDLTYEDYRPALVMMAFRIIFCIYFIAYGTIKALQRDQYGKRNWRKFVSVYSFIDWFMMALFITTLAFAAKINADEKKILKDNYFHDFSTVGFAYRTATIINAWSLFCVMFRMVHVLTISKRLYLLTKNISIAIKDLAAYVILISPLIIGFCFLALSVWGSYFIYYRNFGYALLYNVLFSIGIGNTQTLIRINAFWTLFFYICYLFFVMFFVTSSFIGIYMDAYRQVRIREGYRDDVKVWGVADYIVWFLGCFPKTKIKSKVDSWMQARKMKKELKKNKEIQKLSKKQMKENEETEEEKSNKDKDEGRDRLMDKKVTIMIPN